MPHACLCKSYRETLDPFMPKGKIASWKDDRGFGYISPNAGGADVFVHITDFLHRNYRPQAGDDVRFSISRDGRGRPKAANVTVRGVPRHYKHAPWSFALVVPAVFMAALIATGADRVILAGYLAMSSITWLAYYADKQRARADGWRTPESKLQLLALAGGWPGAVLAQQTLRHKTRKLSFQAVFWAIVAVHIGVWTFLWLTGLLPEELVRLAAQAVLAL